MTTSLEPSAGAGADTCAPPSACPRIDMAATSVLAGRLKALSDPTRLQLLELIASHPGHTACICDLTEPLSVTQPTVSHHMRLLTEAGFVTREQRGRWVHYTICTDALVDVSDRVAGLASHDADAPPITKGVGRRQSY